MAFSICLDAGHGGYDNGATFEGRKEKEESLRLVLALGEALEKKGYTIYYTRTTDVYQSPYEKAQIANRTGADFFLSIHRNSAAREDLYDGVQSLVYQDGGVAAQVGRAVNAQLEELGFKNLGVEERPGLAVLRRTQMPALLLEVGFINSNKDNEIWDNEFARIVEAIATGIEEVLPVDGRMTSAAVEEEKFPSYYIQTGLFEYFGNAAYLLETLRNSGYEGRIQYRSPYYAVLVGPEENIENAAGVENQLRREGYDTLLVTM